MPANEGLGQEAGERGRAGGLLHSLGSIAPALISLLRTRLELFGIEVAEEKDRAAVIAVFAALAFALAAFSWLLVNVLVLAYFWDGHRYQAIIGLAGLYAAGAIGAALRVRALLRQRPRMFGTTLAELKKDMEALNRVRQS